MLCLYSKTYCCCDNKSDKFKFSSKGLNKRVLEDSGDVLMSKYTGVRNAVMITGRSDTDIERDVNTRMNISVLTLCLRRRKR